MVLALKKTSLNVTLRIKIGTGLKKVSGWLVWHHKFAYKWIQSSLLRPQHSSDASTSNTFRGYYAALIEFCETNVRWLGKILTLLLDNFNLEIFGLELGTYARALYWGYRLVLDTITLIQKYWVEIPLPQPRPGWGYGPETGCATARGLAGADGAS